MSLSNEQLFNIIKKFDGFVIFHDSNCSGYDDVIKQLNARIVKYRTFDLEKLKIDFDSLLRFFVQNKIRLGFDLSHRSKPIIFYKPR